MDSVLSFPLSQLRMLPINANTLSEVLAPRYRTWAMVAVCGKIDNCSLKAVNGTPYKLQ
jgi:hypothetical protein